MSKNIANYIRGSQKVQAHFWYSYLVAAAAVADTDNVDDVKMMSVQRSVCMSHFG